MHLSWILIWAVLLPIQALVPSSRGPPVIEPSMSYIAFDGSVGNHTAQVQASGELLHVLARRCIL